MPQQGFRQYIRKIFHFIKVIGFLFVIGDMYKDKESFITSAYKKKLEEMKKLEEEEKREEYLESIGDVRKQGNLDGFYRHLYDQKINYDENKESDIKKEIKEEALSDHEDKTSNLHTGKLKILNYTFYMRNSLQ